METRAEHKRRVEKWIGMHVATHPDGNRNYNEDVIEARREGNGVVYAHSDAHGLCFEVLHDEGGVAWYDEDELELDR